MDSIPAGAIPLDQAASQGFEPVQEPIPAGAIPLEEAKNFQPAEEYYSTPSQIAKTALEGVAKGVAGPFAPLAEVKLGLASKPDIRARAETNPGTAGISEAGGLIVPMVLTGGTSAAARAAATSGELLEHAPEALSLAQQAAKYGTLAGWMEKAGEGAKAAVGLAEPTTRAAKIGSSIVQNAAEAAIFQSSDEASKIAVQDESAPISAENAIANVGLAGAIGGTAGGLITGVVSPLWKATVGNKLAEFLQASRYHMNSAEPGVYDSLQDQTSPLNQAISHLDMNIPSLMTAAIHGEPKAIQLLNELREAQHPEVLAAFKDLPNQVEAAVTKRLNVPLEDAAHYSENEAGHDIYNTFTREYNEHYDPVAKQLEERNRLSEPIKVPDEDRLDFASKITDRGIKDVNTDSPYYKVYTDAAERILAKDDIGGLDKLKTEMFNKIRSMNVDINEKNALRTIRNMINDFQEAQINKLGVHINTEGLTTAEEAIAQRAKANQNYVNFSKMSQELSDHLGVGDFTGAGTLKDKLGDVGAETLLKKFSPKGNVDSIPFLQRYFPATYQKLQEIEAKKFLSSAVYKEQGVHALDVEKLNRALENTLKGSPEYARFLLPPEVQQAIQAAKMIMDAIPRIKSSGTAGWISKLTRHLPASVLSAIGFMMGHNPVSGYVLGELAQYLGKNVPEAMKLSYLKYLGSDKRVQAEGFKAMYDTLSHSIENQHKIVDAAKAVLGQTGKIAVAAGLPESRVKLDSMVKIAKNNPSQLMNIASNSQLGTYMPLHQSALTSKASAQLQYLSTLKPQEKQTGALDKPVPVSPMETARYNRALDIANSPNIVMQRIHDGTLQATDIIDLQNLYPGLRQQMMSKLQNEIAKHQESDTHIPYATRMSLSMFLGQPLDSTMTPMSIQAAQFKPQRTPTGVQQNQKGRPSALKEKGTNRYQTPNQEAERDRAARD